MYWHSPKGAFTAIDPPVWLQHDLQIAEARTPLKRMRSLVLFADQLPAPDKTNSWSLTRDQKDERLSALDRIFVDVFGMTVKEAGFCDSSAWVNAAKADTNGEPEVVPWLHKESGFEFGLRFIPQRIQQGLVLLPSQTLSPQRYLAAGFLVSPSVINPEITPQNLQRTLVWHELGHVWRALCVPQMMSLRKEERLSDVFSQRGCAWAGDGTAVTLTRDIRALDALRSAIEPQSIMYWNALTLQQRDLPMTEELKAQMEVKVRAARGAEWLNATRPTLYALTQGEAGRALRQDFAMGRYTTTELLRNLQVADRTREYHSPAARRLAHLTLRAAERVLPGLISP